MDDGAQHGHDARGRIGAAGRPGSLFSQFSEVTRDAVKHFRFMLFRIHIACALGADGRRRFSTRLVNGRGFILLDQQRPRRFHTILHRLRT